jgi:hypothetical protein
LLKVLLQSKQHCKGSKFCRIMAFWNIPFLQSEPSSASY